MSTTPAAGSSGSASAPAPRSTAAVEAEITAFFEDYIDTVNKSWTSKKALERRRGMFADTCSDCLAGYRFAKRAHQENLTITGDDAAILDLEVTEVHGNGVTFAAVRDLPPGELIDTDGNVVQKFDEYHNVRTVYRAARRESGSWRILESESE